MKNSITLCNNLIYVIDINIDIITNKLLIIDNKDIFNKLTTLLNDLLKQKAKIYKQVYSLDNNKKCDYMLIESEYERLKELL